ncbi:MAG: phospholipase D-like domain-containing protein [bacterium]|nr:phospholipase D-like domain-containing protein [bacterium]
MLNLVTTYPDSVNAICREIADCDAGDQIVFSLYIWEPGSSSDRVLIELESAVQRGARIIFDIDHSYVVRFARFVEKTETYVGELRVFEKKYPESVSCLKDFRPNHKKYYLFNRHTKPSTLIFGSMNLGDRFSDWKDVLVVFKDEKIGAYIYNRFILGQKDAAYDATSVQIMANEPAKKVFEVEPALTELFSDSAYDRYQVTTPYIDRRGVALISKALEHNAKVELIIPACANIYQNANMRTLTHFSGFSGVTIYLYNKMIHAKTILATGPIREKSCVGSANLKKNSFDKLGEFNGLIVDSEFNRQLGVELASIIKDCKLFTSMPYKKIMSRLEEFFG